MQDSRENPKKKKNFYQLEWCRRNKSSRKKKKINFWRKKIPWFFPSKKQNNIQKCKESNKTTIIYKQQPIFLKNKKWRIWKKKNYLVPQISILRCRPVEQRRACNWRLRIAGRDETVPCDDSRDCLLLLLLLPRLLLSFLPSRPGTVGNRTIWLWLGCWRNTYSGYSGKEPDKLKVCFGP